MVLTVFRSRLRPEAEKEYAEMAAHMRKIVIRMPGFIAYKTFTAPYGERVTIVEFVSEETHHAWREHPEHQFAQQRGREHFYSEYAISVCTSPRQYSWKRKVEPINAEIGKRWRTKWQ